MIILKAICVWCSIWMGLSVLGHVVQILILEATSGADTKLPLWHILFSPPPSPAG